MHLLHEQARESSDEDVQVFRCHQNHVCRDIHGEQHHILGVAVKLVDEVC